MKIITLTIAALTTAAGVALATPHHSPANAASVQNAAASATKQISIDNFTFRPATLTVPVGTTVTWINRDDVPHTVKTVNQGFKSPALDTDQKYSFHFTKPGVYAYFCTVHPMMKAKVIVK
jgi:amicyanin